MDEKCLEHSKRIVKMEQRQHDMEIKLTKIDLTTDHIKGRIDNGMSTTITNISKKLDNLATSMLTDIMPAINDSKYNIGLLKKGTFFVVTAIILIGIGRIAWSFIGKILGL